MGEQIADRYNPSRQLKVNADGSIDVNIGTTAINVEIGTQIVEVNLDRANDSVESYIVGTTASDISTIATNQQTDALTDTELRATPVPVSMSSDIEIGAVEIKDGSTEQRATVDASGQLHVVMQGTLDTGNSTTNNLLAGAVFTGVAIDTSPYAAVTVSIYADVVSATNGLDVQYSVDGSTDWHSGENYTILAGATKFFTPTMQSKFMRVVYTNGAGDQGDFHIHTMLRKTPIKWSSHNIEDPIVDQDDAELVKAVITGKKASGAYDNVSLTNGGNMKVSIEEYETGANPIRKNMEGGGQVSVGTSAVEVTFTGTTTSIIITADKDNSGLLFVGESNVASDGSNALTFLRATEALTIDYDDTDNAVYVVSDTTSQNFWKGALL